MIDYTKTVPFRQSKALIDSGNIDTVSVIYAIQDEDWCYLCDRQPDLKILEWMIKTVAAEIMGQIVGGDACTITSAFRK